MLVVISTGGPVVSARSGEIWSRMEVIYGPWPDVSTVLDMTQKKNGQVLPMQLGAAE